MSVNSNTKFKVIGMTNQSPYLEMSELIEYLETNGLGGGDEPVVIVSSDISDATATGISLLTASSPTSARQSLGAGTSNLALGSTATTAAAGNHTHDSSQITKAVIFEGDTTTNVQEALIYLYGEIQALKNPTP